MLWLSSSGKTQKIGWIYRIWVLKFIRASLQEWRFLSNRSSDHDVSHIKQNYPISSRCYKRLHVEIFICVAKKLNWNRGLLNDLYIIHMLHGPLNLKINFLCLKLWPIIHIFNERNMSDSRHYHKCHFLSNNSNIVFPGRRRFNSKWWRYHCSPQCYMCRSLRYCQVFGGIWLWC